MANQDTALGTASIIVIQDPTPQYKILQFSLIHAIFSNKSSALNHRCSYIAGSDHKTDHANQCTIMQIYH